jgi:hypothetical protein
MHPVISPEIVSGSVQMAVYFVTALAAFLTLMLTGRA